MATKTPTPERKTTITCKILHKETNQGIPDLLVVLMDVDSASDIETAKKTNSRSSTARAASASLTNSVDPSALNKLGDRLGSALTNATGSATFQVDAFDFNLQGKAKEQKPDLLLLVLTHEEPGIDFANRILFISKEIRMNAGSKEAYLIKLDTALLQSKQIPLPQNKGTATDRTDKLKQEITSNKDFLNKKREAFKETIVNDRVTHKTTRKTTFTQPFIDLVSNVPKSVRQSNRFYKFDKSLFAQNFDNISTDIGTFFGNTTPPPHKTVQGSIYLTPEEQTKYSAFLDSTGTYYILPETIIEEEILPKLFRKTVNGSSSDFIMDHPADVLCRNTENTTAPTQDDNDNEPTPGGGTLTDQVILQSAANQLSTATSPEQELLLGIKKMTLEKRPNEQDVANSIRDAVFQKGPADVPAFYEFHSLKIAFENIWQETFDLGLIDNADKWYDQVLANGGNPSKIFPTFPGTTPGTGGFVIMSLFDSIGDAVGGLVDAVTDLAGDAVDFVNDHMNGDRAGSSGRDVVVDHRHDRRTELTENVVLEFPEAIAIWKRLSDLEKNALVKLADKISSPSESDKSSNDNKKDFYYEQKAKGKNLIEAAIERLHNQDNVTDEYSSLQEAHALTRELTKRLNGKYSFKHYAANGNERSINFGVLLSYQQKWEPLDYQAGELVKTIPLAPKEVRKFSKKTVIKKSRSQKEQEENLRISKTDTQDTSRAESEIVNKAANKSAFDRNNTSSGGINEGPVTGNNTTTLNLHLEAQRDSQQTKKEFHESVVKASQEYKNERKIEISTEESYESEVTESGEISNPNDELTVTYLFYELQRKFKISERLYRMRPVIMVAQEMPAPHNIDNDWVVAHDWILKRVLLDDEFRYGIDCILIINGDRLLIDELERTVKEQRLIIKDLRQNVKYITEEVSRQNRAMMAAISAQANVVEDRDIWDGVPIVGDVMDMGEKIIEGAGNLLGMGAGDNPAEAARMRSESITAAYERAQRERTELMARLERESSILNELTKQLALKRKDIIEKETHIQRLKTHIKDNILYYMQAIWNYEHKDQRFFRLLDTKVPVFDGTYKIKINATPSPFNINDLAVAAKTKHAYQLEVEMEVKEVTLKEVADLDNMLGYKGNYMIFPMVKSNILTDYMMAPYIDSEFGLLDPDNMGNWSLDDFEKYVKCLKKQMGDRFTEVEENLKNFYKQLLQDPLRNGDIITVPTGSLFIEALPGAHTILEYFKLAHRYMDVKKVQAEVRGTELENLRYAARILDKQHEDPKIDKKIVVEGNANPVIDADS
ncbi:MAG TPA: hypothetical protein PKN75_15230 [Bacteroidia bacterium]|nr:hypothetical protein [Bacteroidia bacterium]